MAAKTHREIEDESMKLVGDGSNLSNGGEDYDKKYEKLLAKYGLERKKTDYEKDMDEYGPRIKAAMEKTKEANQASSKAQTDRTHRSVEDEDMKRLNKYQTTVKTTSSGYAEAETTDKPNSPKKPPLKTPVEAPNLKKPGSSTSEKDKEKDKEKGNSKEAAATPKKPAETPKGGYKPENQDVGGTQRRRQILSDAYTGGKSWPETRKNIGKGVLSIVGAPLKYVNKKLDEQNKKGKNPKPYQLKINS